MKTPYNSTVRTEQIYSTAPNLLSPHQNPTEETRNAGEAHDDIAASRSASLFDIVPTEYKSAVHDAPTGKPQRSPKVIFTGFVNDVAPYYNIMNLNLNCSIGTETSSLALSEGMSLSIPAIATTYGGNPFMITDGVNGFLVPERDPAAMAEKICEIIENPSLYEKLSKGAYEMYEKKFTASAMTRQLEELYEKSYDKHVGK